MEWKSRLRYIITVVLIQNYFHRNEADENLPFMFLDDDVNHSNEMHKIGQFSNDEMKQASLNYNNQTKFYEYYDGYEDDDIFQSEDRNENSVASENVTLKTFLNNETQEVMDSSLHPVKAQALRRYRSRQKPNRRRRVGQNNAAFQSRQGNRGYNTLSYHTRSHTQTTNQKDFDCDFYTPSLCLNVRFYPRDEIMAVLNQNRRMGTNLIADVSEQSADNLIDGVTAAQENKYTYSHYFGNSNERQPVLDDEEQRRDFAGDGGFLCPSEIRYAKPKRGKTAQGQWKIIVNVADYTQTLRMEKCLKPGGTCSYVSHHYQSECSQIYNYHRLLSWNKKRGLHMDIFKVPTCCSCHIRGYSYVYPPLTSSQNQSPSKSFFSNNEDNFTPEGFFRKPTRTRSQLRKSDNNAFRNRHGVAIKSKHDVLSVDQISSDSNSNFKIVSEQDTKDASSSDLKLDETKSLKKPAPIRPNTSSSVNYGFHPIVDFFQQYHR